MSGEPLDEIDRWTPKHLQYLSLFPQALTLATKIRALDPDAELELYTHQAEVSTDPQASGQKEFLNRREYNAFRQRVHQAFTREIAAHAVPDNYALGTAYEPAVQKDHRFKVGTRVRWSAVVEESERRYRIAVSTKLGGDRVQIVDYGTSLPLNPGEVATVFDMKESHFPGEHQSFVRLKLDENLPRNMRLYAGATNALGMLCSQLDAQHEQLKEGLSVSKQR